MPYADRNQQLAAMREWRRKQKLKSQSRSLPFLPRPQVRRPEHPTPADAGQPVSVKGRHIGWIGQAGEFTKEPPAPPIPPKKALPRSMHVGKSERGKLLDAYNQLRALGYSDASAQVLLMRRRQEDQDRARAQKEASDYTRAVEARITSYMEPARRWLLQHSGMFTPAQQLEKARQMAAHEVLLRQTPRLPDEWTRLQIPAPAPGYPMIAAPPPSWTPR